MMDRSSLGCPFTLIFFLCGPCKQEQEQRQTYQHLWHKTPPSHPLSVYVFPSPTISSLPSFVPSCQCCAKEPSPFSLTHLSCPLMMVSPFLILSLSFRLLFLSVRLPPSSSPLSSSFLPSPSLYSSSSLLPPPPHACTPSRERVFFFRSNNLCLQPQA